MYGQSLRPREMYARPNGAPSYYLGRPAAFWIIVMSPRTKRAAADPAQTTRHPVPVPRQRRPQAGEAMPPAPRLSAVYWTPRSRRSAPPIGGATGAGPSASGPPYRGWHNRGVLITVPADRSNRAWQ
jgi:hypothetical protein